MAKKKKMTAAQAAAARHDQTEESIRRAKAKERSKLIKQSAEAAQKEARKTMGIRMAMPFLLVLAIVIGAIAMTVGPGLFMKG